MAYFSDLNTNVKHIKDLLLADQTLCQLLYNSDSVDDINPVSATPLSDTGVLWFRNIFPLPKAPTPETDRKSILNYYFLQGSPQRRNTGFRNVELCFDVICHIDCWGINDGIRPYYICNRIDAIFNNRSDEVLTVGDTFFKSWVNMRYGDSYYGYRLIYQLGKDSNVGCE